MGKLIAYIMILVVVDVLFLITGQLSFESTTSIITSAIFQPQLLLTSLWWTTLIKGAGAISTLIVTSTVIAGIATRNSDIAIFGAMASGLVLLLGDFLIIYNHLRMQNETLALLIMSPILVIFGFTIVEWLRGKD